MRDRPFDRDWWNRHPINGPNWRWHGSWANQPAAWFWRGATWGAVGGWFVGWGWSQPYDYAFGTTIVYRDNFVYVNDQQYATSEAFYQQASTIAQSAPAEVDAAKVEWMPLGVFEVAQEDGTDSSMLIQLAVSREGILAGTYFNETTGSSRPLEGMVDRKSQRAAWKFADGQNADVVMETGIYNLTQDEANLLVHFGAEKTQNWLLVRLPEPQEMDAQPAAAPE